MIRKILEAKTTYTALIALNVLVILGLFVMSRNETGGDIGTYIGLADGILHGRYSFWWFMPDYYPDTFRNPGYPIFLAFIRVFTTSLMAIRLVHLALYFTSIYLLLKIVSYYTDRILTKNILLILLLMSVNITAYVTLILPEILVLFLLTLSLYIDVKITSNKWYKYLIQGLIYGFIFQIRPAFLFVPFIKLAYDFFHDRQRFRLAYQILTILVLFLTMIPYACWNKANHGVFSITSLEGGAGVINASQWSFKIPNHKESRYWVNVFPGEMISEKDPDKVEQNFKDFNKEWDQIDSICAPYLTQKDSALIKYKAQTGSILWITYNAQYTLKREKVLKQIAIRDIKADPVYFIKIKAYTFCRLWFTGLFSDTKMVTVKYKNFNFISPYMVISLLSLFIFLMAVVLIPIAFIKNKKAMLPFLYPLILLLYFGVIHTPFAIQSRYTTPVKLLLIMLIAQSITIIFFPQRTESDTAK